MAADSLAKKYPMKHWIFYVLFITSSTPLLSQTVEAPVRAVTDPGVVTRRQGITPAGVQTVFEGRVYGLALGRASSELWVLTAGALAQSADGRSAARLRQQAGHCRFVGRPHRFIIAVGGSRLSAPRSIRKNIRVCQQLGVVGRRMPIPLTSLERWGDGNRVYRVF